MMLFWRSWRYTIDVLYYHCLFPSACGGYRSTLFTVVLVKNVLNVAHVLRLVVCHLHYIISSLNVDVCSKRVIPLGTIITLAIVCPPACTNYLPFSNSLISRARGYVGS